MIGMKIDLSIGQRSDQFAILADVRDEHDGWMMVGHGGALLHDLAEDAEILAEPHLLLLAYILAADEQYRVIIPSRSDCIDGKRIESATQVYSICYGPDDGGQFFYG